MTAVANALPAFRNLWNEAPGRNPPNSSRPPQIQLLTGRVLRVRSLLTFLHVLLEPRLPLGYELSQLRLLVRGKNLVSLGGDARVLHFKLSMNLRSLSCNCLRLGLIKRAALDELHHLLMSLHFLLEQRFHRRLLFSYDLFDLRLLRVAEIQVIGEETQHGPAKKVTTTTWAAVVLRHRKSRHQDDSQSCERHFAA
jgi:hypothetical protein